MSVSAYALDSRGDFPELSTTTQPKTLLAEFITSDSGFVYQTMRGQECETVSDEMWQWEFEEFLDQEQVHQRRATKYQRCTHHEKRRCKYPNCYKVHCKLAGEILLEALEESGFQIPSALTPTPVKAELVGEVEETEEVEGEDTGYDSGYEAWLDERNEIANQRELGMLDEGQSDYEEDGWEEDHYDDDDDNDEDDYDKDEDHYDDDDDPIWGRRSGYEDEGFGESFY